MNTYQTGCFFKKLRIYQVLYSQQSGASFQKMPILVVSFRRHIVSYPALWSLQSISQFPPRHWNSLDRLFQFSQGPQRPANWSRSFLLVLYSEILPPIASVHFTTETKQQFNFLPMLSHSLTCSKDTMHPTSPHQLHNLEQPVRAEQSYSR